MRHRIARHVFALATRIFSKVQRLRPQHFHRFCALLMGLGGGAGLIGGLPWQMMMMCFAGSIVALAYARLHTIEDRFDQPLND